MAEAARILFFDAATATGWACGDGKAKPRFGTITLHRTGDDIAAFLIEAEERYSEIIGREKPALIAFESPALPKVTQIATLRKLYGLANEIEKLAKRRRIPCREREVFAIRRHFLGPKYPRKGADAKRAICARCIALGWKVEDDNQGDALAGLDYMLSLERPLHALKCTPMFAEKHL